MNSVGGIFGLNGGTMASVSSSGQISGAGSKVGGLVGSQATCIYSSSSSMNITAQGSQVGGLVGITVVSIQNSSFNGAVYGSSYVGGLIGVSDYPQTATFTGNSIGTSSIPAVVNCTSNCGGVAGELTGYVQVVNNTINLNASGTPAGYVAGAVSELVSPAPASLKIPLLLTNDVNQSSAVQNVFGSGP
jgi:hypothetical protein